MQEHGLLQYLGYPDPLAFWTRTKQAAQQWDADEILVYMKLLLECGKALTRQKLTEEGAKVPLFEGLEQWFERVNQFGAELGLELEHYIISSGLEEMVQGCSIRKHFRRVYASRYCYDQAGIAVWPASAINYTTKTQFLFRINKGVDSTYENRQVNEWLEPQQRPVPFERMIFIGDGETDIPAMKMVRYQGGYAVAVFDPKKFENNQQTIHKLIAADRCNYVAPADYRQGSQLDVTIGGILSRIASRSRAEVGR